MKGFFNLDDVKTTVPMGKRLSCVSCGLYRNVQSPKIEPYGDFERGIMVIGEAPGETEDDRAKPWQGVAGKRLKKAFRKLGVDLFRDCVCVNAVNCRPTTEEGKNRKPNGIEISCCREVKVIKAIKEYKPKMIILLGGTAVDSFLGYRWARDLGGINKWRGWTIPDREFGAWVCPTFHPSYVNQSPYREVIVTWKRDLRRAFELIDEPLPPFQIPEITYVNDLEVLCAYDLISRPKMIAFDYETTGLKPQAPGHRIVCVAVAVSESRVFVFQLPKRKKDWGILLDWLRDEDIKKIGSNIKYEDTWTFDRLRTEVNGWFWDTMLASHIMDNRPGITSIKFQAYVQLGIVEYDAKIRPFIEAKYANDINRIDELASTAVGMNMLMEYCAYDAIYEYRVAMLQIKKMEPMHREAYDLFHNGVLALAKAERQGIRLDVNYAHSQREELTRLEQDLTDMFMRSDFYVGWKKSVKGKKVNLNSGTQLEKYLYGSEEDGGLGLEPNKTTPTGKGKVDEEALESLNIQALNNMVRIRKIKKLRDTYLESFIRENVDGYIHPSFNLNNVVTYRSSSSDPNFQNIPIRDDEASKAIRGALYPRPGHRLLEVDYGALEVRIAACYHKDTTMLNYIKSGFDLHADMTKQIFFIDKYERKDPSHKILRGGAKNGFVFPQFYGDYYANNAVSLCKWGHLPVVQRWSDEDGLKLPNGKFLSRHLKDNGIRSFKSFTGYLQDIETHFWEERFPEYNEWKDRWFAKYQKRGYFDTLTGFRCSGVMSRNDVINYPVQGSAFHCLLWSFNELTRIMVEEDWDTRLIGQIHDSAISDVHPDEMEHVLKTTRRVTCVDLLEHYPWIIVPLDIEAEACEVDESWHYKKEIVI